MFTLTLTRQLRSGVKAAIDGIIDNEHDKGADEGIGAEAATALSDQLGSTLDNPEPLTLTVSGMELSLMIQCSIVYLEMYTEEGAAEDFADDEDYPDYIAAYQWAESLDKRLAAHPIAIA